MKNLSEFYNLYGQYSVPYQGEDFLIEDKILGDLSRHSHSSEEVLTNHYQGLPLHVVKGIIGDMVRYYQQIVRELTDLKEKKYNLMYLWYKGHTVKDIWNHPDKSATELAKAPTDKFVSALIACEDESRHFTSMHKPLKEYHQAKENLGTALELLGKLTNTQSILEDTYRVSLSLNANERMLNGLSTKINT